MNPVIETLITHRSDRSYLDKAIPDAVLDDIILSAYRAPTSVHSQQVSVIVTRDKATKAKIAELAGGQPGSRRRRSLLLLCWICIKPVKRWR